MALNLGFVLWQNGQLSCGEAPIQCGENPRPVSIVPRYWPGTDDVDWTIEPACGDEWSSVQGARNGIAVTVGLQTIVYDVDGAATSDEVSNSPYAKLATFLSWCCEDCDPDVIEKAGQYQGTFPSLSAQQFCFNVTITGVTDYPTAWWINTYVTLKVPAGYLASDPKFVSYNEATDTLVVNLCLTNDVTASGAPIGFPDTWTFADA